MSNDNNKIIIEQIKSQLSGVKEKDVVFLQNELRKYKSKNNEEIIQAISYLLFEYLDPEIKKKYDMSVHRLIEKHQNEYNQANQLMNQGKLDEAKTIIRGLLAFYDKGINSLDDRKFFDFGESMEYFIYCRTIQNMRNLKIKRIPEPVTYYCYQLATISIEQNEIDEAINYLQKALLYNPTCQYVIQELIDRLNQKGQKEQAHELLLKSLEWSFTKAQLAFCYHRLGKYYFEKEIYDISIGLFSLSDKYLRDPNNENYIKKIVEKVGYIRFTDAQSILDVFHRENIQYGPSELVMNVFGEFVDYAYQLNQIALVKYLYTIAYELTDLEEFKEKINELEGNKNNDKK